ncbi:MAG: AraC family transcriptional regulator [Dechloromonas sp.]|nr:AraC family transcriptional regulator [Dechloromonas sp.]
MPDMDANNTEKGTISICFVEEALRGIRQLGFDCNALLLQAGISPELLSSPQARVSSTHYGQLWHGIAQTLDDEFFGMDSHRMKAGSFTLLCHTLIHSDSLERALRRALRFLGLVLDDMAGELHCEAGVARIVLRDAGAAAPKRAFAYGTYLLILHGLACWLVGRRIPVLRADFRCPEPGFSSEWRILFAQELGFDQPHSGISFPLEYLAMPNIQNERTMKEFLRSAPANFLVKYKNSTSLTAKIRRRLREMPPSAWPDFATLAQQFHASAATLRRRLDDEGQSYRSILDDLRRDLAITLLSDTQQGISEIAEALGFAEPSAFHRAFKKWTGARPGEYRCAIGIRQT